jgi:hypothetical protein
MSSDDLRVRLSAGHGAHTWQADTAHKCNEWVTVLCARSGGEEDCGGEGGRGRSWSARWARRDQVAGIEIERARGRAGGNDGDRAVRSSLGVGNAE